MKYLEFITTPENVPGPNGGWIAYPSQIIIDDHPFLQSAQEVMLLQYSAKLDEQAATIASLTAAHESMQEDAVQNTYAFNLMLTANKAQAEEIRTLKQALTDIRATTVTLGDWRGTKMSGQVGQHGGWLFSVYYSTFDTWAYLATKLDLTHEASGTVKATNATEAIAAVLGLIDSGNLNETELKVEE